MFLPSPPGTARAWRRSALRLLLAISITAGAAVQPAGAVCRRPVPITDTDLNEHRPDEASDPNLPVSGIDPFAVNRVTSNPYTDADGVTGRVAGGDYAAVAIDINLYNEEKNQSSSTARAGAVNTLVLELNTASGGGQAFIAGHLVNHEFGGNKAGQSNFTALTHETNMAMSNHGEGVTKAILERINTYYETTPAWVAQNGTKKYKPGILYETKITDGRSILQYEDANGTGSLISNPNISDAAKAKMTAKLETTIRFILHEYDEAGGSRSRPGLKPTGNWYNMPPTIFNDIRPQLLPTTPTGSGAVEVDAVDGGREITWTYWNRDH